MKSSLLAFLSQFNEILRYYDNTQHICLLAWNIFFFCYCNNWVSYWQVRVIILRDGETYKVLLCFMFLVLYEQKILIVNNLKREEMRNYTRSMEVYLLIKNGLQTRAINFSMSSAVSYSIFISSNMSPNEKMITNFVNSFSEIYLKILARPGIK